MEKNKCGSYIQNPSYFKSRAVTRLVFLQNQAISNPMSPLNPYIDSHSKFEEN